MDRFGLPSDVISPRKTHRIPRFRFSLITDSILRVEYSPSNQFVDLPSQTVMSRDFGNPSFEVEETKKYVQISTKTTVFRVKKDPLQIAVWVQGKWKDPRKAHLRGGTARTLDNALGGFITFGEDKGRIRLSDSIFSKEGITLLDDSSTHLLREDGTLVPREEHSRDLYVFAFGKKYLEGLKEYYSLTGFPPLLPKFALGNWWSRYHAYTQEEYLGLMSRFEEKGIPFTVATLDMDWHLVNDIPQDVKSTHPLWGPGWTGYTVNEKLFPDFPAFLQDLKSRGLAVTMNLHPHDGIRYFEKQYEAVALACGVDPKTKAPVSFDFTSHPFLEAYFDLVLHPYEDLGVDFWWIDWQQGKEGAMGLDPLWLLNHYHYLDASRGNKPGLILSRYAGPGSHRYPLGFSGDTIISWKSLDYQPGFTLNSSNAGYSWWSHDIGGHMLGKGNPEIYARWIELGVFSPINRLHSSCDKWSKEPWLYGEEAERIATDALILRHRLLPYLYTMNVLTAKEGVPLVQPLYYRNEEKEAYEAKNEYYFGSEMIVAPVTTKRGKNGCSRRKVFLPEGTWYDFFTGEAYEGKSVLELEVPLSKIPVFVKEGGIVPLLASGSGNSTSFESLEVKCFPGEGNFLLRDEIGTVSITITMGKEGAIVTVEKDPDSITKTVIITMMGAPLWEVRSSSKANISGNRIDFFD
ncbi:MAG: glycoside hydrolase family 31 protein [Candidatus Enteromonas sp.]|nr:glycoside hydrolase family 31 protein [Candidatus Enteromonas sp.]